MRFLVQFRVFDLFGQDDRAGGVLPPELEGKSPLEVAQYYQQRMTQLQPPPRSNMPPPPPPVSREDYEADPLAAAQRLIQQNSVSREEFTQLTQAAQAGLVAAARMSAMQGKKYWTRLLPEMESIAKTANPIDTTNPNWWNTTYNYLVGSNLATLQSEEAEAAAAAARAATEGISNPALPPPTPRELSSLEQQVASGLGIDEAGWRKGEERVRDGRLPVTLDNRRIA